MDKLNFETKRCYLTSTTNDDESDIRILYADISAWEYLGGTRNQEQINLGMGCVLK